MKFIPIAVLLGCQAWGSVLPRSDGQYRADQVILNDNDYESWSDPELSALPNEAKEFQLNEDKTIYDVLKSHPGYVSALTILPPLTH